MCEPAVWGDSGVMSPVSNATVFRDSTFKEMAAWNQERIALFLREPCTKRREETPGMCAHREKAPWHPRRQVATCKPSGEASEQSLPASPWAANLQSQEETDFCGGRPQSVVACPEALAEGGSRIQSHITARGLCLQVGDVKRCQLQKAYGKWN